MLKRVSFLLFLLFFFITDPAYAQQKAGFAISPPSFEINAQPGDVIKNAIKVENLSSETLTIKNKAQNFTVYGEGGQVNLTDEDSSFSISNWIQINNQSATIRPNAHALFNFEIKIPTNAEPGSHYGAVVFYTDSSGKENGSGAGVSQEVGSLILIKLPGNVNENAKLISFKPDKTYFTEPSIKLNALLENTGNIHIKPYGFLTIYSLFGNKVKTIEVAGRNILPGSKRIFDQEFKFSGIGYYRAELNLIYANGGGLIKSDTHFIALNTRQSRKYTVGLGMLLMLYLIFRKRFNRAIKILIKG